MHAGILMWDGVDAMTWHIYIYIYDHVTRFQVTLHVWLQDFFFKYAILMKCFDVYGNSTWYNMLYTGMQLHYVSWYDMTWHEASWHLGIYNAKWHGFTHAKLAVLDFPWQLVTSYVTWHCELRRYVVMIFHTWIDCVPSIILHPCSWLWVGIGDEVNINPQFLVAKHPFLNGFPVKNGGEQPTPVTDSGQLSLSIASWFLVSYWT